MSSDILADPEHPANVQWGGRFTVAPAATMQLINASIGFDRQMWRQDIRGSCAHAKMLAHTGIISGADAAAIDAGLAGIAAEIQSGTFVFSEALEDIHMNIEAALAERIGEPGRRLHTARSRNDQVATDFRLWVRDAVDGLDAQLADLMTALATRAAEHAATAMPGFTHLQIAQPVTFGHHLLAYVEMLSRDRGRLVDCRARLNHSPLGAAALAGTGFPIDREMTAAALGFAGPCANSLDAVSDRDFTLEYLGAVAICAVHLSRFAEEVVIWCSAPFGFVTLSDALATGSSIMPQKRNPDAAELVRAKTGTGRIADGHERLAARLCQRHAGGQGAGVRRHRRDQPVAGRHRQHGARHAAGCRPHAPFRRRRILDGHRSGRLAGAGVANAVPHGASRDRPAGGPCGGKGGGFGRAYHGRNAGRGTRHHSRNFRCADGGGLARLAHQFWRHGAGQRRRPSGAVAG